MYFFFADLEVLHKNNDEFKVIKDSLEKEIKTKSDELSKVSLETSEAKKTFEKQINNLTDTQTAINERLSTMDKLVLEKDKLELEKIELISKLEALKVNLDSNELKQAEEITKLKKDNQELIANAEENKTGTRNNTKLKIIIDFKILSIYMVIY